MHLTTILSKRIGKMVGAHLVPYLQRKAFAENQWAFTPKLSSTDLVAMLMLPFILAVCTGKKVIVF